MRIIHTPELKAMKNRGERFELVDVLPPEVHQEHHIPGSDNIPVDEPDFVSRMEERVGGKDAPVVVYCASRQCDASPRAARKLEEAGFKNVLEYEDGIAGWEKAGYPLESGA